MNKIREHQQQPVFRLMFQNRIAQTVIMLLVCIMFLCLFVALASRNSSKVRLDHYQEKLVQAVSEMESELQSMDYRQRELLNSASFQRFCFLYDDIDWYTRFSLQKNLYNQLTALRDRCAYVDSAYLYIPNLQKTVSDRRVGLTAPEWLPGRDKDGVFQTCEDGCMIYTTLRMDETLPNQIVAVLSTKLDEEGMLRYLSHLRRSEADEITPVWNPDAAGVCPFHLQSGRNEKGEYTNLCLAMERFPLHIHCVCYNDGTDSFVQQIIFYCILFILIVSLILMGSLFSWYRRIYLPLHHLLIDAFDRASQCDYKYRITIDRDSAFFSIYDSYNHMMEKTDAYVENNLKQQILVNRANLKLLQSQISPHFMYNSYYVLYRLIKKGDQQSSLRLAEHLGQFYHYVTRNADDEKHLVEEVNHARNYAAIQKFRFRDTLDIEIDEPQEEIAAMYVPRLILQPLLENAFKYAYESETADGVMKLLVHYELKERGAFVIIVENSGKVTDETLSAIREKLACSDDTMETTALVNIHRRLRIYYGEESCLEVDRSPMGGLRVRMHIEERREEETV